MGKSGSRGQADVIAEYDYNPCMSPSTSARGHHPQRSAGTASKMLERPAGQRVRRPIQQDRERLRSACHLPQDCEAHPELGGLAGERVEPVRGTVSRIS
jgi:hypothetical protein